MSPQPPRAAASKALSDDCLLDSHLPVISPKSVGGTEGPSDSLLRNRKVNSDGCLF